MSTMRIIPPALRSPVHARQIVGRVLVTLQRVGTDAQKQQAKEIEDVLVAHYSQPEVVNFAREETVRQAQGESRDSEGGK